jgi:hypothetical protein
MQSVDHHPKQVVVLKQYIRAKSRIYRRNSNHLNKKYKKLNSKIARCSPRSKAKLTEYQMMKKCRKRWKDLQEE